jgi:hypothetical protein
MTIINLLINSGDAKTTLRHLWKAVELQDQHYKRISTGISQLKQFNGTVEAYEASSPNSYKGAKT